MKAPWKLTAMQVGVLSLLGIGGVVQSAEVNPPAEVKPDARQCPTLDVANTRLQARATVLLQWVPDPDGSQNLALGAGQIAVALANVIAARAKEEARLWLKYQISEQICKGSAKGYFPNTCRAMPTGDDYPGPSLGLLGKELRRDVYSLPACYVYKQTPPAKPTETGSIDPNTDSAIDGYVLEAALVGALRKEGQEGGSLDGLVPDLLQPVNRRIAARLLVGAALGRLHDTAPPAPNVAVTFRSLTLGRDSQSRPESGCNKPQPEDLKPFAAQIIAVLENNSPKPTAEQVINELVVVLKKQHICDSLAHDIETLAQTYASLTRGDYVEAALAAAEGFLCGPESPSTSKVCSRIVTLGELASAKNQEETEAALDHLISPLGSWKRKQSESAFSLQAMAGVAGGVEKLKNTDSTGAHQTFGLYMPVGVEWSHPADLGIFKSWAIGLTALDLGALASYGKKDEVDGGQTSSSANVKFSSITSPGVYAALALKNSPFRAGLSLSRTPELRSVRLAGDVERDVDSTRVMLFFAVDVTLMGF